MHGHINHEHWLPRQKHRVKLDGMVEVQITCTDCEFECTAGIGVCFTCWELGGNQTEGIEGTGGQVCNFVYVEQPSRRPEGWVAERALYGPQFALCG